MRWIWGVATAVAMGLGGVTVAQDAPPAEAPAEEVMTAEAPAGPQWKVFSRSAQSNYLIDLSGITTEGEEMRASIARVANAGDAGNYAHVVDTFGIRCATAETQVVRSTEVFEDGEGSETYETGEPWTAVRPRSLDEAIKDLACDDMVPGGAAHASIRAYIDAGRP